MVDSAVRLNVKVQTGLHTGECDVFEGKYSGFAVDLAQEIADQSPSGEILVSRTVKDLVAGSGLEFEERQIVEGEWRLFAVTK
jgi:class 3 adenylate cyclase